MLIFIIFLVVCPNPKEEDVLNYLNSIKSEEELYQSIKQCPILLLVKEGISRLTDEKYLEDIAKEGDWYIKYLAIPKIKNQTLLKEIYLKESDKFLKEESIKYIYDQEFLKKAARDDKNLFALPNIKDEFFLKELAIKYQGEEIGEKALFFIENPSILKETLRDLNNKDLREIVFLKLKGSPFIKDIILQDFSDEVKKEALNYAGEEVLEELLFKENFPFKREAISGIQNQKFLMEFYENTEDFQLKSACLENIKDEEFLKRIFLQFPQLRDASLKNIEDEAFLMENFYSLPDNLKERAVYKIKNQDFLKKLFKESRKETLKVLAIKRIFDSNFLKDIYENENSKDIKKAILYNLNRGEQEFFKKVALKEKNKYLKAEALKFIEDEEFIKDIILKENSYYVKLEGLKRLSNQEILKEIFKREKEWFIKVYVLEKIKEKNFLKGKEKEILKEVEKEDEISIPLPYEDICVNLKEKKFKDLKTIKRILKDLGENFEMNLKVSCRERRYFNEEEKLYPPLRGRSFQLYVNIEIFDKSTNFSKKMVFSGKHLSKKENFNEKGGKIDGYYVKYYLPRISFLEFTREILKEFDLERLKKYENSKNKYIKAAALIEKSFMEAK